MTHTFAIGDIHGKFDLLIKGLKFVESYPAEQKKIVMLGDYIDRGPDSALVVHKLRNYTDYPIVCLKGNHEDMMFADQANWLYNGGRHTIDSYDEFPLRVLEEDSEWMRDLPTYHVDEHRVFVHAAYVHDSQFSKEPDPKLAADRLRMWYRYGPDEDPKIEIGGKWKYIVHGHTPHRSPQILENRANIDVGSYYRNEICVAVFDDNIPGKPIHLEIIK